MALSFAWYEALSLFLLLGWPITMAFLLFSAVAILAQGNGSPVSKGERFAGLWGVCLLALFAWLTLKMYDLLPSIPAGVWAHFGDGLLNVIGVAILLHILLSSIYFLAHRGRSELAGFILFLTNLQSALFISWFGILFIQTIRQT